MGTILVGQLKAVIPRFWFTGFCWGLFLLHQWVFSAHSAWVDSYLDDVLFLPALFGIADFLLYSLAGPQRMPSWGFKLFLAIPLVLVVEQLFPQVNPAFTYDPWDYLAYAAGFGLHLVFSPSWQKLPNR